MCYLSGCQWPYTYRYEKDLQQNFNEASLSIKKGTFSFWHCVVVLIDWFHLVYNACHRFGCSLSQIDSFAKQVDPNLISILSK